VKPLVEGVYLIRDGHTVQEGHYWRFGPALWRITRAEQVGPLSADEPFQVYGFNLMVEPEKQKETLSSLGSALSNWRYATVQCAACDTPIPDDDYLCGACREVSF
jgi:hypothetical protein